MLERVHGRGRWRAMVEVRRSDIEALRENMAWRCMEEIVREWLTTSTEQLFVEREVAAIRVLQGEIGAYRKFTNMLDLIEEEIKNVEG